MTPGRDAPIDREAACSVSDAIVEACLSKIDRAACLEACEAEDGNLIGRDPRRMGKANLEAAGFEPLTPMEVIRAKCLDCCAGSAQEVRYCVAVDCPSWLYRMGSNPFRPPMSEEVSNGPGTALEGWRILRKRRPRQ